MNSGSKLSIVMPAHFGNCAGIQWLWYPRHWGVRESARAFAGTTPIQ
jgi:hypothetical protein